MLILFPNCMLDEGGKASRTRTASIPQFILKHNSNKDIWVQLRKRYECAGCRMSMSVSELRDGGYTGVACLPPPSLEKFAFKTLCNIFILAKDIKTKPIKQSFVVLKNSFG